MKAAFCKHPACYLPAAAGDFCARHAGEQAAYDQRKREAGNRRWKEYHERVGPSIYNTARWKKLRAEHLAREPLCRGCGAPAEVVDHIRPHREDMDLAYDPDNLQSLCKTCHQRKTRRDQVNGV